MIFIFEVLHINCEHVNLCQQWVGEHYCQIRYIYEPTFNIITFNPPHFQISLISSLSHNTNLFKIQIYSDLLLQSNKYLYETNTYYTQHTLIIDNMKKDKDFDGCASLLDNQMRLAIHVKFLLHLIFFLSSPPTYSYFGNSKLFATITEFIVGHFYLVIDRVLTSWQILRIDQFSYLFSFDQWKKKWREENELN